MKFEVPCSAKIRLKFSTGNDEYKKRAPLCVGCRVFRCFRQKAQQMKMYELTLKAITFNYIFGRIVSPFSSLHLLFAIVFSCISCISHLNSPRVKQRRCRRAVTLIHFVHLMKIFLLNLWVCVWCWDCWAAAAAIAAPTTATRNIRWSAMRRVESFRGNTEQQ